MADPEAPDESLRPTPVVTLVDLENLWKHGIINLYSKICPAKLADVDSLIAKYGDAKPANEKPCQEVRFEINDWDYAN